MASPAASSNNPSAISELDAGFFERLFQSAGFAIITCDPDGSIAALNEAASRLFDSDLAVLGGKRLSSVFAPDARDSVAEQFRECIDTLKPVEFNTRLGGTEMDPIEYAVILAPVRDADGALQGVAAWFRDITARTRLARSLAKRERLNLLGGLSGAVAHHYNNLLCSIATSVEYAMNMNTMTAMRRALQRSGDAVERAASITQQLLAVAQADHRASDLSDLTECVLVLFDELEPRLARRNIELALDWQQIPPSTVLREQIRVVLTNIVDNALEAMPNGGTLTVTLAMRDEKSVLLSIADTGGGISPNDMEHLFEPFHTSKSPLGGGVSSKTGLGLAVAHGLIQEMGGTITACNVPGCGARFDIILKITPPE